MIELLNPPRVRLARQTEALLKAAQASTAGHGSLFAAIDLGSNSFRLEIARVDHGQFERTDYIKESVRQGAALDAERNLSDEGMQRGWNCLARFGERLAGFQPDHVRAVATQTLREARNRQIFLARARTILGFPIDVISGREEARLIYLGVAKMLPQSGERRLVADIGGRSTELILGQGFEPKKVESYRLGSIVWTTRYFPDGLLTPKAFRMAEIAAKAVLDEAFEAYRRPRWDAAYGSAGTIGAVGEILAQAGWPDGLVSRQGLDWLLERLLEAQSADRLRLAGLKEDRRMGLAGGLSILRAIFDLLQIDEMQSASGGLRTGVLSELARDRDTPDVRRASVQRLLTKFNADIGHGDRVGHVALQLLGQLRPEPPHGDSGTRLLGWAASLHEIGAHISHTDSHKHGAYILDNADAMGFAQDELHHLSLLVLGQRGKLRKLDADFDNEAWALELMALRLAIILCHARREPVMTGIRLCRDPHHDRRLLLTCPVAWADAFPQSMHRLREEVIAWERTPWSLTIESGG